MARSYDIADLIILPRLDAGAADALVTELLSLAKGKKLESRVESARKALAQRQKELQTALTVRLQALPASDTARAKAADQAEDAAFSATFDWLTGFSKLPDSAEESAAARSLLGALFRDGLKFTQLPYKLEWAEADARLRAIDADPALASAFARLGGEIFLKTLRKAHKEYGAALGITSASAKAAEPPNGASVKEPLGAVRAALRTYALRVLAHADGDEAEIAAKTSELLAPLLEWQSHAGKSGKAAKAAPESPAAPTGSAGGAPNPEA
jgi:hypothetical protein